MRRVAALLLVAALVAACGEKEAEKETEKGTRAAAGARAAYDRGLDYLAGRFREDGWIDLEQQREGPTALAIAAFANRPGGIRPEDRALLDRTLDLLVGLQQDDGGIYAPGGLANYTTCAAVLALAAAGRDKDRPVVERAVSFLKGIQFDENRGVEPTSENYGGLGYGTHEQPDLSNTQYSLESLRAGGVGEDDPVFKKVLAFLQRTQNFSETNPGGSVLPGGDGRKITPGDDGGAAYRPDESKAGVGTLPDGSVVLRSYGSMTYALLKCYVYAGLKRDDPRVQAALRWVKANWTWDENPGFASADDRQQGLYYYYSVAAEALSALGLDVVEIDGVKHDWRKELGAKLVGLQRADGSWVNAKDRWWEGIPELATAEAMVALRPCVKD